MAQFAQQPANHGANDKTNAKGRPNKAKEPRPPIWRHKIGNARDPQAAIAARIDARERFEVAVQIQAQAVIGAAATDLQSQRGDLRICDINTGHAGAPVPGNADAAQRFDDDALDQFHQLPHPEVAPAEIQQQINHQLAGPVVGDLPAAVARHDRNVAGRKQMLATPGQTQRVHRRMLREPDLVRRARVAHAVECAHRLEGDTVVGHAERTQHDRGHARRERRRRLPCRRCEDARRIHDHSAICTIGWSDRSW